jgi:hypothetical protein
MSVCAGLPGASSPTEVLEQAVFTAAITLFPERLTIAELVAQVVQDPADRAERDSARNAIRDLRKAGLLRYENVAELVEPTHAAIWAYGLLSA